MQLCTNMQVFKNTQVELQNTQVLPTDMLKVIAKYFKYVPLKLFA